MSKMYEGVIMVDVLLAVNEEVPKSVEYDGKDHKVVYHSKPRRQAVLDKTANRLKFVDEYTLALKPMG